MPKPLNIWTPVRSPEILHEMSDRLAALYRADPQNLRALPPSATESKTIGDTVVCFSTFRNQDDAKGMILVVQALVPGWHLSSLVKFGRVAAEGFSVGPGGEREWLEETELWDYR
jgi:hypothetical protein